MRTVTSISRTRVGRRAAIGAVIAAVLVCAVAALPGTQRTAAAATTVASASSLNAGLADVRTVQGVFVFDGQPSDAAQHVDRVTFAYDAEGDGYFDVRYKPDLAAKRRAWLSEHKTAQHSDTDPQFVQTASALVREVVVMSGARGLQQTMSWSIDPFTGKIIVQRYRFYAGFFSDGPLVSRDARSTTLVWKLAGMLDSDLPTFGQQGRVRAATVGGGPGWQVTVREGGRPTYTTLVDRYGLAERVASIRGWRGSRPYAVVPFHVQDLVVNRRLPVGLFTMNPSYAHGPDGYSPRKPGDTADKYGINLAGERSIPLTAVRDFTSSWTLLPGWLPPGYRLTQVIGWSDEHLWFVYRHGLLLIEVGTAGRRPAWITDGGLRHGFVFGSRGQWGQYGWAEVGTGAVSRLRHGAMTGWPAGETATVEPGRNAVGTVAFGVSGTAPFVTLRRIAESLRQARPGPHLPSPRPVWPLWIALAAAAASFAAALRAQLRQAGASAVASLLPSLPLLIGVAATAAGASLAWHALYSSGDRFVVRGWSEPLAVLCVAAALLAGTAALWPRHAGSRPLIDPRFLATGLGLASLAAALVALIYLPLPARFSIDDDLNLNLAWTSLHAFAAYFRGAVSPAPGVGLYLSIGGAVVVVVAGLRLHPRETTTADAD